MADVTQATTAEAGSVFNVVAQARRSAGAAARRADVTVHEVEDMADLRAISRLFESVWGRTPEGVPVNSELLRSLVHAGGCATAAHDGAGNLVGAAALAIAAASGTTYSLIAAVTPGTADRGIGHAVKLRQRAWCLERDFTSMVWTFDPLVRRNARFNLVKLGAVARHYAVGFYGEMTDLINGADEADRLVAEWELGSGRAIAASEGTAVDPGDPETSASPLVQGPDGEDLAREDSHGLWVRIPHDVVALRRRDPAAAEHWRTAVRHAFVDAFERSLVATHVTRQGWYLLEKGSER